MTARAKGDAKDLPRAMCISRPDVSSLGDALRIFDRKDYLLALGLTRHPAFECSLMSVEGDTQIFDFEPKILHPSPLTLSPFLCL